MQPGRWRIAGVVIPRANPLLQHSRRPVQQPHADVTLTSRRAALKKKKGQQRQAAWAERQWVSWCSEPHGRGGTFPVRLAALAPSVCDPTVLYTQQQYTGLYIYVRLYRRKCSAFSVACVRPMGFCQQAADMSGGALVMPQGPTLLEAHQAQIEPNNNKTQQKQYR